MTSEQIKSEEITPILSSEVTEIDYQYLVKKFSFLKIVTLDNKPFIQHEVIISDTLTSISF